MIDKEQGFWQYRWVLMKACLPIFSLFLLTLLPGQADDGLPVLRRQTLPQKLMWQLETELTGQRQQNGAVQECLAAAASDLLQTAGYEPTVANLVRVLTSPSESGSFESALKELLLPQTDCIEVSADASFALLRTHSRAGQRLDIFRNTARGLMVQRLLRGSGR